MDFQNFRLTPWNKLFFPQSLSTHKFLKLHISHRSKMQLHLRQMEIATNRRNTPQNLVAEIEKWQWHEVHWHLVRLEYEWPDGDCRKAELSRSVVYVSSTVGYSFQTTCGKKVNYWLLIGQPAELLSEQPLEFCCIHILHVKYYSL